MAKRCVECVANKDTTLALRSIDSAFIKIYKDKTYLCNDYDCSKRVIIADGVEIEMRKDTFDKFFTITKEHEDKYE